MSGLREGHLHARDGLRLRTLTAEPREPARGRAVFVHGFGDHAARWFELFGALSGRGFGVLAYDQRGHGASEGGRGRIGSFERLLEDLDLVLAEADAALPGPGAPFLVGHSLGGLVVLRHLQTHGSTAPGTVLSAPWLATAVPVPGWLHLAGRLLARFLPRVPVPTKLEPDMLTRDPERIRAFEDDPLVQSGVHPRSFLQIEAEQDVALGEGLPSGAPTLVLLPGDDRVADASVTAAWAERARSGGEGSGGESPVVWSLPGMRHEVFQEVGREALFMRVADWMEARSAGPGTPE